MNRRDLCLSGVGATVSLLALKAAATGNGHDTTKKSTKHDHNNHHSAHHEDEDNHDDHDIIPLHALFRSC